MSSSDEDYDDSCGDDSDMEIDWQKVGMVVGGVVCGLLLVGGIVALMVRKRKKAGDVEQMSKMLDHMENQMDQREARGGGGGGEDNESGCGSQQNEKRSESLFGNDDAAMRSQQGPAPPPAYGGQQGPPQAGTIPYQPPSYQHQDQHFGTFNSFGPDVMR